MENAAAVSNRPATALPPEWDGYTTFTVDEFCEIVRLGRTSTYKAVASGEIKSIRIGNRVVIPRTVIERMLAAA